MATTAAVKARIGMLQRIMTTQITMLETQEQRNAEASADRDWSRVSEGKIYARKLRNAVASYRRELAEMGVS